MGTAGAAEGFLSDRHVGRGVTCESCHTTMPPKAVNGDTCLKCHGPYSALAKKTDDKDINPHDTHLGEADCSLCHKGHKKPVLACDECHEFRDMRVP